MADMWIHESFTDYSESVFVDSYYGKQAGQEYTNGQRNGIANDRPVVGVYNVNKEGSEDMYSKGSVVLNMIRTIINDDEKWRDILRGLNKTFYHKTVTYDDITEDISKQAGIDLTKVFDQYLKHAGLPTLQVTWQNGKPYCKWIADVKGFDMPVRVKIKGGEYQVIHPTTTLQPLDVPGATKDNLEADTFHFYILPSGI